MAIADIMKRAKASLAERSGGRCTKDADGTGKPPPAEECAKDVDDVKWYVIHSRMLDDRFVLCMRRELYKEVTARFPDTVIYFLPEMEELLAIQEGLTREQWCRLVREVHVTKKTFHGWIVPSGSPYMRELGREVKRTPPPKGGQSNAESRSKIA